MTQEKRKFLIVDTDPEVVGEIAAILEKSFGPCTVFTAKDGTEGLMKLTNVPPNILITAWDLPRHSGSDLVSSLLRKAPESAVIVLSDIPEQDAFVDEVVKGQVRFLKKPFTAKSFLESVNSTLGFIEGIKGNKEYKIKFLAANETLFHEGEKASSVYILRSGKLRAFKKRDDQITVLGEIIPGEFVGEMAHINSDLRSADVEALENSELIEIPSGTLDVMLFAKPVWSQALMKSLSKRLKQAIQK